MLQHLREKAQGWFSWIILGAIGITFVLFGTANFFQSGGVEHTVAKVNGASISKRELEEAYRRVLHSSGNEALKRVDPAQIKKEVLEGLIEQRILLQNAKKLGLTISDDRVNSVIRSLPVAKNAQGQFSEEAYLQFLSSANFTDHSFRAFIRDNMVLQQMQRGIAGTALALSMDVKDYVQYAYQHRDFQYTRILQNTVSDKIAVPNETLKEYYDSHLNQFMTSDKIALQYVHLSFNDVLSKLNYTDQDLEAFYRDNLSAFTIPESAQVAHILVAVPKGADPAIELAAKEKIEKIRADLSGTSFEALAREYSDDKASAEKGGELSWFAAGEMVPEFEKAAFALAPNEVSVPIKTEFGYHLIKLEDKKPGRVKSLSEVREDVIDKYKHYHAEEKFAALADEMAQLAFDTSDSLQPVSDKVGKPIEKTSLFSEGELKDPLLNRPEVMAAAFSTNVKEDKNNSDLIKLDDENFVVIRLADWVPVKQKSFEEVKSVINQVLVEQKTEELLKEEADRVIEILKKDPTAEQNYSWNKKQNIDRMTREVDANLLEAVFSMPRWLELNKPELKAVKLSNGDYAIVWLIGVTDGNAELLSESEKKSIEAELQTHWGRLEYALYVADQIGKAQIKKN